MAGESGIILVTGSNGQLGNELKEIATSYPRFNFVFTQRNELSLSDPDSMQRAFEKYQPAFVINCAAYTAVDKAEEEKDAANMINGEAVGILAGLAVKYKARLIHISTDYVFSGNHSEPLKETDPVDPVNAYGESKLLGEKLCMQNDPGAVIIRTSWVYSSYGKNFVKTMIRLMNEREQIGVVNDQFGSPTYAADLAVAIMNIIDSSNWVPGIYHYSNKGKISWYEFAMEIKKAINSPCIINPITTSQFPTPARRPAYSVLDTSRIEKTYQVKIPDWKSSLHVCLQKPGMKIS